MSALLTSKELEAHLARWRTFNKAIVFTNGCFDVFHAGHVHLLEEAAAQGDTLIVALNDDASVKRLKGPSRPINTLEKRARVVAAMRCVDAVISFAEDTPANCIANIKPDVLVKGADYAANQVVGREHAKRVHLVSLIEGLSTTGILNKGKTS